MTKTQTIQIPKVPTPVSANLDSPEMEKFVTVIIECISPTHTHFVAVVVIGFV